MLLLLMPPWPQIDPRTATARDALRPAPLGVGAAVISRMAARYELPREPWETRCSEVFSSSRVSLAEIVAHIWASDKLLTRVPPPPPPPPPEDDDRERTRRSAAHALDLRMRRSIASAMQSLQADGAAAAEMQSAAAELNALRRALLHRSQRLQSLASSSGGGGDDDDSSAAAAAASVSALQTEFDAAVRAALALTLENDVDA